MTDQPNGFTLLLSFVIWAFIIYVFINRRKGRKRARVSRKKVSKKIQNSYAHHRPAAPDRDIAKPALKQVASIGENTRPKVRIADGPERAEIDVDSALRGLKENRYFVFRDLIIPTSYKDLSLTQIDHVVVSHYGIFCIETKSNQGNVYGFTRGENWKQYLGPNSYNINSPFRQNRHHVRSLELLLQGNLRAPVHSYIAFPNAKKVVVDSKVEDMSPKGVVAKINKHTQPIYDDASVERIAKTLAHAATYRESLRGRHADEVRAYVESKIANKLKFS